MQERQDMCMIPGSGRCPGVGNGTPLQYSCLGHPMNRREEPGGLQSMGLQSHRHDWATEHTHALQLSDHFSRSVMAYSLRPHGLQHIRLPCPSPAPRACSNSCPLSQWYYPIISSSVVPFSSCLQSSPASGSFQMSQLFLSGGQSIGVSASASVLPLNTQDWFPLGWIGWISLQSKGLSRVFSSTTVWRHQFFSAQPFFIVQLSHPYMTAGKKP